MIASLEHIPPQPLRRLLSCVRWEGTPESGTFALTFDDGPDPEVTPAMLESLARAGAYATFFLVGSRAARFPGLAREIADAGHMIGNHSMNHRWMFFLGAEETASEIDDASKAIADAAGTIPAVFRPPYGLFDFTCARAVRERGLDMVLWTVLSGDYSGDGPETVLNRVKPFIRPGAIVVFHDTREGGGSGLPRLIDEVLALARERGVAPGRVDGLSFHDPTEQGGAA